eukprot:CAMPEP_0182833988 /NCGR_PEP_ID=MMETSP0006_2-20121128/20638_1 /TAXON_ID=97485 /ORGANISM="Prymnesium parvum, Strain Texoma1" /LENGTH=100 /DNA_ID=CAMNT_0024962131 /DNA_START=108 /DNA_END=410 /DNA_ORIENTATION=+
MIDHGELTAAVIAAHSKPSTQAYPHPGLLGLVSVCYSELALAHAHHGHTNSLAVGAPIHYLLQWWCTRYPSLGQQTGLRGTCPSSYSKAPCSADGEVCLL